jgi:hypothetical protein
MYGLNEVLDLMKQAQANPASPPEDIFKASTWPTGAPSGAATAGLTYYDLEAPAKKTYPVITPLRNRIARVGGGKGTAINWKAITGINTNGLEGGVSSGNRGGVIATTIVDKLAAYRGIGFEDFVDFEADMAAQGFDDVRARAVEGLLRSLMIYEEKLDVGGNTATALGTTPTPTTALVAGGALTAQATNVICIALTLQGYLGASVAGGVVVGPVSRTNADSSTDAYGSGAARKSAASAQTTAGGNLSISATVAAVRGAVAYAWYIGASGSELLHSITTINSQLFVANAAGTQNASAHPASDQSVNALVWDGLITQCYGGASAALTALTTIGATATIYTSTGTNGSGSLIGQMATGTAGTGTPLTADGKGGVVEIDAMLRAFWDVYRLSPDTMYVSSQEAQNITLKILAGSSNPAFRFNFGADQRGLMGGVVATTYLKKFAPGFSANPDAMGTGSDVKIRIHPNIPSGTILFYTDQLPYPTSNIGNVVQKKTRRDYYQLEWPLRSRKYEYGVYMDGVLQNYFTPAFGLLTNIANG